METLKQCIEGLRTARTINDLNIYYISVVTGLSHLAKNGYIPDITEEKAVEYANEVTNYNIVRVAEIAYQSLLAAKTKDERNHLIIEIARCRDSVKPHEHSNVEYELINNLCVKLKPYYDAD